MSLSFHDVDPDSRLESSRGYQPMATTDADKIVEFVEQVAPNVDVILVHCKAGISRSAAVAMWIAARYELPFDHSYPHINDYVMRLLKEADRDEKIEYSETDLSIKKRESQERFVAQVKAGTSKPSDASRLKMATTFMRKTPILRSRFTVIL